MPFFKPKLRWFQFRLRSLLVLTLAVALWLGWELRQTDLIGGHVAAIREMGGTVELESSHWSLLRYVDPDTYGRRAVSVEVPIDRAGEARTHLARLPALREVCLATDGTADLCGTWAELSKALPGRSIMPIAQRDEKSERSMLALPRFLAKMEAQVPSGDPLLSMIREQKLVNDSESDEFIDSWARSEFHLVPLPGGSIAEVLLTMDWSPFGHYQAIAIMLTRDRFVDAKGLWSGGTQNLTGVASVGGQAVIEDIDGDGHLDVGFAFEAGGPRVIDQPVVKVPGFRGALGVVICLSPLLLLLGSIGFGWGETRASPIGLALSIVALLVGGLNFYLSFTRPWLYRWRRGSMENYCNVSGFPLFGTLLVVASAILGFGDWRAAAVAIVAMLLDTGGLPWLLIMTWRDSSFWDQ